LVNQRKQLLALNNSLNSKRLAYDMQKRSTDSVNKQKNINELEAQKVKLEQIIQGSEKDLKVEKQRVFEEKKTFIQYNTDCN
jgi:hypothetical protein